MPDVTAQGTNLANRPEGCYYFRNYQDGTGTLWVNSNSHSKGYGAETGDLAQGMLREPICMKHPAVSAEGSASLVLGGADTHSEPKQIYQMLSTSNCRDAGGEVIDSKRNCETAAAFLGLVDLVASQVASADRPEGCYHFRNGQDLSSTLWFNTSPLGRGKGAETSDLERGLIRQPVCFFEDGKNTLKAQEIPQGPDPDFNPDSEDMDPNVAGRRVAVKKAADPKEERDPDAKFAIVETGRCVDRGWRPINEKKACLKAAKELGFVKSGVLEDDKIIVASIEKSPEGCYLYSTNGAARGTSSADGMTSLWLNTDPKSAGNGAAAGADAEWQTRRPLCSKEVQSRVAALAYPEPMTFPGMAPATEPHRSPEPEPHHSSMEPSAASASSLHQPSWPGGAVEVPLDPAVASLLQGEEEEAAARRLEE
jgi:hypothetical protein